MTLTVENDSAVSVDFDIEDVFLDVFGEACDQASCPYEAEVFVRLVDDDEIRAANSRFRGIDSATDVLSFPLVEYESPADFSDFDRREELFNPDTGQLMLGDVLISLETAKRQAGDFGHSLKRETAFLFAHSMLHLFGFDHMDDDERRVMEKKQEEILSALGITREQQSNKTVKK